MARKISLSVSDWVFDQIRMSKPKQIGRSEYVEELIRIGLQKNKEVDISERKN